MSTTAELVFSITWLILTVPTGIYWLVKFYQFRQKHPIQGRYPLLSTLGAFACYLISIYYPVLALTTENGAWSCYKDDFVILSLVVSFILCSYILRVWILFFQFRLIPQQLAVVHTFPWVDSYVQGMQGTENEWYLKHQYLIKPKFLGGITIGYTLFRIFLYLPNTIACRPVIPVFLTYSTFLLLLVMLVLVAGIVKKSEGKFIKSEFKMAVVISLVHLVSFTAGGDVQVTPAYTVSTLMGTILVPFYFATMIVFPLSRAIAVQKNVDNMMSSSSDDEDDVKKSHKALELTDILSHTAGKRSFTNFLETELAVENILFWDAAENFRFKYGGLEDWTRKKRRKCAKGAVYIYDIFISVNAPLQINIPFQMKNTLEEVVGGYREQVELTRKESMSDLLRTYAGKSATGPLSAAQSSHISNNSGDQKKKKLERINSDYGLSSCETPRATDSQFDVDPHVFDEAVKEIINLMQTPFYRFLVSDFFKHLIKKHPELNFPGNKEVWRV